MPTASVRGVCLALSLALVFVAGSLGCGVITGASVAAIVASNGGGGGSANSPPVAQAVSITSTPSEPGGPQTDIVEIQFTLVDAEGDAASVEITIEPTGDDELVASITGSLDDLPAAASGTVYKVFWESLDDVVNVAELVVRVSPANSGGEGVSAVSSPFAVVNDPPTLTVGTFPAGEVEIAYGTDQLEIDGGIPPFTLEVSELQLPPGLVVDGDGLTGTPTEVGTFTLDYLVRDSVGSTVRPDEAVEIRIVQRLALDTEFVPIGNPGADYAYTYPTVGGEGTLTFEVLATSPADARLVPGVPDGIVLSTDGLLSGTCPTADALKLLVSDDFEFDVRVTDELGATAQATYIMRVRDTFETALTLALPFEQHRSLAIADVDNDVGGAGDLIVLTEPDGLPRLVITLPEGELQVVPVPTTPFSTVDAPRRVRALGSLGLSGAEKVLLTRASGLVEVWGGAALATQIATGSGQNPFCSAVFPGVRAVASADLTPSDGDEVIALAAGGSGELRVQLFEPGTGASRRLADLSVGVLDPDTLTAATLISDGDGGHLLVLGLRDTVFTAFPEFQSADPALTGFSPSGVIHPINPQIPDPRSGGSGDVTLSFQPAGFAVDAGFDPPHLILGCAFIDKANGVTLDGALALLPDPNPAAPVGSDTRYVLGSALFSQPLPSLKPSPGGSPQIVDLDEDSIPDLVLPLPRERSVAVIFGRPGTGPLDLRGALRVAVPSEANLVDVRNHDGDPDKRPDIMAAASFHDGRDLRSTVTLVRNIRTEQGELTRRLNAPAVFLLGNDTREGAGAFGPRLAIEDFDGDGERDVVVHRNELRNDDGSVVGDLGDGGGGTQTFDSSLTLVSREDAVPVPETETEDEALAVGSELSTANFTPDANTKNQAGFAADSGFGFAAGDIDDAPDARAEVALAGFAGPGEPSVSVLGLGNGGALETRAAISTTRVANHLIMIDLGPPAADGATNVKDLVAVSTSNDGTVIEALLQQTPSGAGNELEFTLAPGTEPASLGQTRAAFAGDLDGDDRADVILATQDIANKRPQVFVFTGVGEDNIDPTTDSAFAEGILVEVPSAGVDAEAIDAALFDSDEDGDLDVALLVVETVLDAGQNAFPLSSVIVLENQGDGTLLDLGRRTVLSVVHDGALGTQDLDGDGVTDLCVLGSGALGRITLLIGRGDGSFAIGSTGIVGREAASLEIADVDRDNVPDIVVFTESYDEMLTITTDGNGNLIRWTR